MTHYRIRTRAQDGCMTILADDIPDLETAYRQVAAFGKGTSRKFSIDEITPKLFSNLTAGVAVKRLNDMKKGNAEDE